MAFDIDFSRSLRTNDQLRNLVRAVVSAAPADESRALEWKKGYSDLTSIEASYAIGRAILGFANRMPAVAATQFEGAAYIVIGAEPGMLSGQHVPDSANVVNAIGRFSGQGFPLWDGREVSVDGTTVFVVTVEPPRAGDRFALLQKDFQPYKAPLVKAGTVFVRQPGATERATKEELEMLQDRLINGSRRDAHHEELRIAIDSIIGASRRWADTMIGMLVAASDRRSAWSERDLNEWVNTDSGVAQREQLQVFNAGVRRIRLLTTEQQILAEVEHVEQLVSKERHAWNFIRGTVPFTDDNRAMAAAQIFDVRGAAERLEEVAVALLAR
jgi:hypothetical protein